MYTHFTIIQADWLVHKRCHGNDTCVLQYTYTNRRQVYGNRVNVKPHPCLRLRIINANREKFGHSRDQREVRGGVVRGGVLQGQTDFI